MKTKKILLALLLSAVVVSSATACGTSTPVTSVPSTESTLSTQSAVSQASAVSDNSTSSETKYSDDNDTKVKQMLENVTFDGKKLSFPSKASDLGSGYSFSDDVSVYENKYAVTYLLYNGEKVTTVTLLQYDSKKNVDEWYAYSINLSNTDDIKFHDLLKIDKIGLGDNIDSVISKFGKPTNIDESENTKSYVYETNENVNKITILSNNNFIEYIGVTFNLRNRWKYAKTVHNIMHSFSVIYKGVDYENSKACDK